MVLHNLAARISCVKSRKGLELKKIIIFPYKAQNLYINLWMKAVTGPELLCIEFKPNCDLLKKEVIGVHLNWFESISGKKKYLAKIFFLLTLKVLKKKIIITVHNRHPHDGVNMELSKRMMRLLFTFADNIIIMNRISEKVPQIYFKKEEKIRKLQKKMVLIPHPNYVDAYPESNNITRDKFKINQKTLIYLFLGMIRPYKNIEIIVDTAKIVEKLGMDCKFVIAGKATDQEYKENLKKRIGNLKNVITLFRYIDDSEISGLLSMSDVVLLPYKLDSILNSGAAILAFSYKCTTIGTIGPEIYDLETRGLVQCYQYESEEEHKRIFLDQVIIFYQKYYENRSELRKVEERLFHIVKEKNAEKIIRERYYEMLGIDDGFCN